MKELTLDDLSPQKLKEEFDSGLWHDDIAAKYHISPRTIYKYVKKWNLDIPRKNKKKEVPKYQCKRCGKWFTKLNDDGYCHYCEDALKALTNNTPIDSENSELHNKILSLRQTGKAYSEIAKELKCAKSTVAYHCNKNVKEQIAQRKEKYKLENRAKYYFQRRLSNFKCRKKGSGRLAYDKDWNKKLRTAVSQFRKSLNTMPNINYTYKDVIEYFGGTIVTCELTGRTIDLTKDNYNIDHIVPIDRGGTNELDNMAFCIPEANAAKNNLTNDEFVALCKEVCEHFGYKVTKE